MARFTMPDELQQVIDLPREMFGGYTMQTDDHAPADTSDQQPPAEEDARDEQLGDGGKKALEAERRRARDLEKQLYAASTPVSWCRPPR